MITDHATLAAEAAEAMRRNGRIPEPAVLDALSDDMLREIIAYHTGPFYVA